MFKAITQFKATGIKGGYVLQWQGAGKPSYIVGKNNTCCWYHFKKDALAAQDMRNNSLKGDVK